MSWWTLLVGVWMNFRKMDVEMNERMNECSYWNR